MERKIKHIESFCDGKVREKNDDCLFIGKNFVAVIDGVSHKSSIDINGERLRIADIITKAIETMDRVNKTLTFEEAISWINLYIKGYLSGLGLQDKIGTMEATAAIYSEYHNQIWIVGDCRALYDGRKVQNPLKVDELYIAIRKRIIQELMNEGYTKEQLIKHDMSKDIITKPDKLSIHIKDQKRRVQLEEFWNNKIKEALLRCGFSNEQIERKNLVQTYHNPRDLQKAAKNNPNFGPYGYAIFNGERTETSNCTVVALPENVKRIVLSTDGFPLNTLNKDIGHAVRMRNKRAKEDILSKEKNSATHNAAIWSSDERFNTRYAIDDATAVIFEVEREHAKEVEEGR